MLRGHVELLYKLLGFHCYTFMALNIEILSLCNRKLNNLSASIIISKTI